MTPLTHVAGASRSPHRKVRRTLSGLNMTIADLARMSGVRYDRLVRTLAGYQDPTPELMSQTAKALGLKPYELWEEEPNGDRGARASS